MYAERLPAVPQGNPRNLPSLKPMPSDLAAKPPAPQPSSSSSSSSSVLVERFKALLKQRDEEFRVSPDDDGPPPPPSTEEIVDIYRVVLSELVMNSKPIITELTIIAGDHLEHAEGIADAICSRIIEVPAEQKLPALYLLDSIVKNIGPEYVAHFAPRLHEVFCSAYRQVDPSLYVALDRLFRTWSTVFPHSVLHKIGTELQSLRISHGIHVNPNKVRLLEHTAADTAGGATRLRTAENIIRSSYPPGVNKLHSSSNAALTRPLSPLRQGADTSFSSEIDEYAAENILRRFDRASPAHPASEYGLARVVARDEQASDWRRNQLFSDGRKRLGTPMLNVTNGREHVNPRALIDAYGDDKRKHTSMNKTNQIGSLDIRGKAAPVSWQDTEEQEFNWEDMNPTLADSNRSNNILQASVQPFGGSRLMAVSGKRGFARETDIINKSSGQHPVPARDDSFIYGGDASMISEPGSMEVMPVLQSETYQVPGSPYSVKPMKLVSHTSHMILDKGRVANFQATTSAGGITTDDEKLAPPYRKLPITTQIRRSAPPRMDSSTFESTYATNIPTSVGMWPLNNVHKSNSLPVQPVLPLQKQSRSSFISSNSIANQGPNPPLLMADQKFDTLDSKELVSARLAVNQHGGIMAPKHQSKTPNTPFQPPFLPSREAREKIPPYSAVMGSSHLASSSFNYGQMGQGRGPVISSSQTNSLPMAQPSLSIQNIPNNLMHFQGGSLPPLPPGPPPIPSQTLPISQSPATGLPNNLGGSAYSGLISNLVAQGLISLTNQAPGQDPVGVDFNMDLLKVRHESAVRALYDDLPRQCTTCGLRFKSQEEHSSHMDWHVTKNRMSKNRKQKPSRKWFVSESMWLSGAEALGSEAVPGFLPAETTEEKKSDEEMAVPADEDQNACALCGEPFDDFYSDETEEWMYKGAVYMNAPDGSAAGMDRSQLGPIVHAKCRSESNEVSPGIFPRDEGGSAEESSQRKRLRS